MARISPRSGCGNGDREGETPGEHKKDVIILLDSITRLARASTPLFRRQVKC